MSATLTAGWMKKTAYFFNTFEDDNGNWDWHGISSVHFWIPTNSRWMSYADFATFCLSVNPSFNPKSHYKISALPEPLVACEPLLAACNQLPLTYIKAKKWYIYEQPPVGRRNVEQPDLSAKVARLQKQLDDLHEIIAAVQRSSERRATFKATTLGEEQSAKEPTLRPVLQTVIDGASRETCCVIPVATQQPVPPISTGEDSEINVGDPLVTLDHLLKNLSVEQLDRFKDEARSPVSSDSSSSDWQHILDDEEDVL